MLLDLNGNPEEIELLLKAPLKKRNRAEAFIQQARLLIRKNELENVQNNLDRAFRLAKNSPETLSVRGEYFMARNDVVNALSAFQSALDAYPETAPERAFNQRMVEQITAIIATQGNEDYSAQRPVVEAIPVSAPATNVLRRKAKGDDDSNEPPSATESET